MKNRGIGTVILLSIITLGIYCVYWQVKTKGEMNARGAQIPTAWLLIVPFVNIWWLWKYSEGVEMVTDRKLSAAVSFLLLWLIGFIGMIVVQDAFNKVTAASVATGPVMPAEPTPTPQPPVTTV